MKKFKFKINGSSYEVSVNEIEKDVAEIEVNGTPFIVQIERPNTTATLAVKAPGKVEPVAMPVKTPSVASVQSPLPGVIMKIMVRKDQAVKRGDILLTIESMKMENNIMAEKDAVIKAVYVQTGQSVMQGDVLIDLE
ncbi:MAG: biotin/lipoyl-binding protein [Prevotellaceae bacterium]|jgi:biotin carboxyl carrier protein|nr:biotin/lipoyl-binding protein [Prevotellaceae bacterium]